MKNKKEYIPGVFETQKFAPYKDEYYKEMKIIKDLNYDFEDFIHYFPCFTGHLTLGRYISLYETYKSTLGLAGHIAEVGVYKGASLLLFSKLVKLFEPISLTQVHGFDWFQGNDPGEEDKRIVKGGDTESYERLIKLVEAQKLDNLTFIHKLDVTKDLNEFFNKHNHLQFKIVFFDAGMYKVVKNALPYFWERLLPGGYLLLDQFNHEVAPGETKAIKELLPNAKIRSYQFGWMPTAYIIKE